MATKTTNRPEADEIQPATTQSSSERVLGVMDLFTETAPSWTVEGIAKKLGLARTTAYRYAKTLTDAGFLASLNAGAYVLGPRIIQLDRQIRLNDPLLQAGPPLMNAIRKQAAGIQLLCSFYGDHVLCLHDVRVDKDIPSGYDRGRPFPLFRGGPSRIILAHLPQRQLKELMLDHGADIVRAGLGQDWQDFNRKMKLIRQAGYFAAPGEINPDTYGISAPIMHTKGVAGSFTIGRRLSSLKEREIAPLIELTVDTAAKISKAIQGDGHH
ncbi:MAG: IclR family transcriptional regulator [Rhodoferax sp.]|nr:IclR family transcriptional regulator [Rhodoferax sp.]